MSFFSLSPLKSAQPPAALQGPQPLGLPSVSSAAKPVVLPVDQVTLSQAANKPGLGKRLASGSLGFVGSLSKRLLNGVVDTAKIFLPPQLGTTLKRTAIWTGIFSVLSFFFIGPLNLAAIPVFAGTSLAIDAMWAFANGMLRPPNKAKPQEAPLSGVFGMKPATA